MREGVRKGFGFCVRQADVISVEQERILLDMGLLGLTNPETLLDTLIFLIALNFALRIGNKHRTLTTEQFEIGTN